MSGIEVYFFGGFRATEDNMRSWRSSAAQQRPDVTFKTYPYPPNAPDSPAERVAGAFKEMDKVVKEIDDSSADVVYVVGHSSGCAISNEVQRRLKRAGKVKLVCLDGFGPDADQRKLSSTQVWVADSAGGENSSNTPYLDVPAYQKAGIVHHHHASMAGIPKSLHFSLVNSVVSDDMIRLGKRLWWSHGYDNCVANLAWLDTAPAQAEPKAAPPATPKAVTP